MLAAAEARRERGTGIAAMVVGEDGPAGKPLRRGTEWRGVRHKSRVSADRAEDFAGDGSSPSGLSPASREALLELAELVPEMSDDDLAFLVEMARRLAGR